jgi:hypothetical protein
MKMNPEAITAWLDELEASLRFAGDDETRYLRMIGLWREDYARGRRHFREVMRTFKQVTRCLRASVTRLVDKFGCPEFFCGLSADGDVPFPEYDPVVKAAHEALLERLSPAARETVYRDMKRVMLIRRFQTLADKWNETVSGWRKSCLSKYDGTDDW